MIHIGKAILIGQVYLTAIMTLIAGMPHFVCRCPGELAKAVDSRPATQATACCGCGACGSVSAREKTIGKRSCCSQTSAPSKSEGTTRSHQAAGSECTKVSGLPKIPAVSSTRFAKSIEVSYGVAAGSLAVLSSPFQTESPDSVSRWTGHSPAPPTDRVISLQRLLI